MPTFRAIVNNMLSHTCCESAIYVTSYIWYLCRCFMSLLECKLCDKLYSGYFPTILYLSRSTRKPSLCTMRKVSACISISISCRLSRTDSLRQCSPPVDFSFRESFLYISIPLRRKVSARISLHGMGRLVWVDTLRRLHNICFLVERFVLVH